MCFHQPCSDWAPRHVFKLYLLAIKITNRYDYSTVPLFFLFGTLHTDHRVPVADTPDAISLFVWELMFENLQTCVDISWQTEKKYEGRRLSAIVRSKRNEFIKKEWIPPREGQNRSICYSADGTGLHLSPLSESGSAFYPIKKFGN